MAYTTIDKPTDYFNTVLYTGTGSSQAITGVGFQPDWVWIKSRSDALSHALFDVIRGTTKVLNSNATTAEYTNTDTLTAFGTDGFTVGSNTGVNASGETRVAWNWLASNTTASNSNGSITSSVSANTTAGFSIATYTGTGSNANVGHGLSSAPELIITKSRGSTTDWKVHTSAIDGSWDVGTLNSTSAFGNSSYTASTNSIFYVGSGSPTNASSTNYVSYLLHSVKGYSKIGSYTGNGNSDGAFIFTGFRPAFIIFKRTSGTGNWQLLDNKRTGFNPENHTLYPNSSLADQDETDANIFSNGFKLTNTGTDGNGSGSTYIFMAFAESPFVNSNGVPTNAR